jgi:hypothetical protein
MQQPTQPFGSPPRPPATRPLIHVLLLITTILTTTVAGAFWEGLDPIKNPPLLLRGLPFAGP